MSRTHLGIGFLLVVAGCGPSKEEVQQNERRSKLQAAESAYQFEAGNLNKLKLERDEKNGGISRLEGQLEMAENRNDRGSVAGYQKALRETRERLNPRLGELALAIEAQQKRVEEAGEACDKYRNELGVAPGPINK